MPGLPAGVDAVCATALAREPSRRYRTAGLLAEDLARLRRGDEPGARLPGPFERAAAWVRRHPLPSALLVLLLLALLGVVALAVDAIRGARRDHARLTAIEAQHDAYSEPRRAIANALEAWDLAPADAVVAMQMALAVGQPAHVTPAFPNAPADVAVSADGRWLFAHDVSGLGRLFALPVQPGSPDCPVACELRDVTSATFAAMSNGASLLVTGHGDGRIVATRPGDCDAAWTLDGGNAGDPVSALQLSPDQGLLLCVAGRTVAVVGNDGVVAASIPMKAIVDVATWLGDGRLACTQRTAQGGARISVWALRDGRADLKREHDWPDPIAFLRPAPVAGHRDLLLVVPRGGRADLWNTIDGTTTPLRPEVAFAHDITAADWSHDGTRVFLAAAGGRAHAFSTSGAQKSTNAMLDDIARGRAHPARDQYALLGDQGTVTLVSFDGSTVRSFTRKRAREDVLAFAVDGSLLVTATWGNEIEVYRLFDPALPAFWAGGSVEAVAWDGRDSILTAHGTRYSTDPSIGALRSWDVRTGIERSAPRKFPREPVHCADIDPPRDRALVVTSKGERVRLLARRDGAWSDALEPPAGALRGSCLACQFTAGDLALLADQGGGIVLWDTVTNRCSRLPADDARRWPGVDYTRWQALAADPDGATIWAGGAPGHVHRFDRRADGSYEEASPARIGELVSRLYRLPDGSVMVGGANGRIVRLLRDGTLLEFARRADRVSGIAATVLDGETIVAIGDRSGGLELWWADGRPLREIGFDQGRICCLAFSPDGEYLLCGSVRSARIWPVRAERVARLARQRVR